MEPVKPIALEDIRAARARIEGSAVRTPLVRLHVGDAGEAGPTRCAGAEIYLKLENLQPIGSFKIRGASNAIALADPAALAKGV